MSSVPPRPESNAHIISAITKHAQMISLADAHSILARQADFETSFLLHFVNETMPADMDRLRPEQVEHTLRLIAAMRAAVGVLRSVNEMSPVARELMGLKP